MNSRRHPLFIGLAPLPSHALPKCGETRRAASIPRASEALHLSDTLGSSAISPHDAPRGCCASPVLRQYYLPEGQNPKNALASTTVPAPFSASPTFN